MKALLIHFKLYSHYLFIVLVLCITACSGGGGGGGGTTAPVPPRSVYIADQDTAGVFELYLVDSTSPGVSTKLNSALPASGDVANFFISFDGTQVLYYADQDIDGVFELYLVSIATPGVSTKVNPALGAGMNVANRSFAFSEDGSSIVYTADQDVTGRFELYQVSTATLGVSTKLNPALGAGMNVGSFLITPDSANVIYYADQDVTGRFELYQVAIATPGVSTKLNPALGAGMNVAASFPFISGIADYILSPDGASVVYRADQDVVGRFELYQVALATPGVSTKLNPALAAGQNVRDDFVFSSDGTQVFYGADQDITGVFEIYQVAVATPGVSTKINPALGAGMNTGQTFSVSDDGTNVVYRADQDVLGRFELYQVMTATPGVSTKLNPALGAGMNVAESLISNDGSFVVYRADQDVLGRFELYQVMTATPGVSMKLNPALGAGMMVPQSAATFPVFNGTPDFSISSDDSQVFYRADQDIVGVFELHSVAVASPGASTKQNPALGAGMVVGGTFTF